MRRAVSGDAPIVNAMTIDVEEHFHANVFDRTVPPAAWPGLESRVCASTDRLLQMLADADVKATFFVLGWVAERQPGLVKRIASLGHEVASHGYAHRLAYDQTPTVFREDVRRAKGVLESLVGMRVKGFRAPSCSVTERSLWALDVLVDVGYEYDASIFPIRHDRYGIPDAPRHPFLIELADGRLVEAPPSTVRFGPVNLPVAGGAYFRLLPYAWTRFGFSKLNHVERKPAIFYMHPWEIDEGQPRLPLGPLSSLRHYRNLERTEGKLARLLQDFPFAPLGALLGFSAMPDTRAREPLQLASDIRRQVYRVVREPADVATDRQQRQRVPRSRLIAVAASRAQASRSSHD